MARAVTLPDALVRTIRNVHQDADAWLAAFPELLAGLETRWQLRVTGLVEDLSFNVVAFAEGLDGTPYVLKLSPPSGEFEQEVAALHLYAGDGICRLVQADAGAAAMLLERLQPGVSFWRSEDDALATRTCAELLLQLWRPVPDPSAFRELPSWCRALLNYPERYPGAGPLPRAVVDRAAGHLNELLATPAEPVLLHGDLHHGNILSATRQAYLAIDPKGVVGARGFDVATFMRNPYGLETRPDLDQLLRTRLEVFSDILDLPKDELAAWSFVHTVLSCCWSVEEGGEVEEGLLIAERLEALL